MIVAEDIGGNLVRTYSSLNMKIERDGLRYCDAVDPADAGRVYAETYEPIEGESMKYSRWGIIKALEKRGLADQFDAYLAENKAAFRRFYGPNYFAADDADFKAMLTTLQGAFKLTDADIAAILAESPYTDD